MPGCQHCYCEANGVHGSIVARCCKCGHETRVRSERDLGDVDWRWHEEQDKQRHERYETTMRSRRPVTKEAPQCRV